MHLRTSLRGALLCPASVLGAVCAGNLSAQETTETSRDQLQEVVVTATRRPESVQRVPIAITALSSSDLAASQIEGVRDLALETPGLEVAARSTAWVPYIRGIGTLDVSAGQESAIATYVDGVYMAGVYAASFMSFNNADRVEVLKGPQGTLFGRNATGGAIQIITRTPTQTPSLDTTVSYGNYQDFSTQFYATGGFGPAVAGDVAFTYGNQGEGYGRNVTLGRRTEADHELGVRSKWIWTPDELTKITLSGDWGRRGSGLGDNRAIFPGTVSAGGYTALPGFQDVQSDYPSNHRIDAWGGSLQIRRSFGVADFNSITAYRKLDGVLAFDNDATPIPVIHAAEWIANKTISEDLELISTSASKFEWVVGSFFMNDFNGYVPPGGLFLSGTAFPVPGIGFVDNIRTKSYAAYTEATFNLGADFRLTTGARWTHDEKTLSGDMRIFGSDGQTEQTIPGHLISATPIGPYSSTYSKPTWRVSLDHGFAKDLRGYVSYNRGYRSGTFNTVAPSNGGTPAVKPEIDDTFELGVKSEVFEHRLRLNSDIFYTLYKELQVTIPLGPTQVVQNAGKAQSYGLETEGRSAITEALHVNFGLALLHATFLEFGAPTGAPCTRLNAQHITVGYQCNVIGNYLPRAPQATFNAGGDYAIPTAIGSFGANLYYFLTGKFYWEPDNRLYQRAYGLLNAQIYWTDSSGHFTVSLYGKNLTNEKYSIYSVAQAGVNDQYDAAPPLRYGISLRLRL